MAQYVVVYITCSKKSEASTIARYLLNKRLIACANIVSGVRSLFWWRGKIDKASESLIIAKTTLEKFKDLRKNVRKLHSYEVPEIIALPIKAGDTDYLDWIGASVKS